MKREPFSASLIVVSPGAISLRSRNAVLIASFRWLARIPETTTVSATAAIAALKQIVERGE